MGLREVCKVLSVPRPVRSVIGREMQSCSRLHVPIAALSPALCPAPLHLHPASTMGGHSAVHSPSLWSDPNCRHLLDEERRDLSYTGNHEDQDWSAVLCTGHSAHPTGGSVQEAAHGHWSVRTTQGGELLEGVEGFPICLPSTLCELKWHLQACYALHVCDPCFILLRYQLFPSRDTVPESDKSVHFISVQLWPLYSMTYMPNISILGHFCWVR